MNNRGRPRVDKPFTHPVHGRVTASLYDLITHVAETKNVYLGDLVRVGVMEIAARWLTMSPEAVQEEAEKAADGDLETEILHRRGVIEEVQKARPDLSAEEIIEAVEELEQARTSSTLQKRPG